MGGLATNMKNIRCISVFLISLLILTSVGGCTSKTETNDTKTIVIYTSVDQVYSEKIFKQFEKETGIKVKAVYDIEAQKTVGLANKIIAEKDNPQADVFWNGEILQTIRLKNAGVLQKTDISKAKDLPSSFVDKNGFWYGFGGRSRVMLVNTSLVALNKCPKTMAELPADANIEKTGIAYPVFGTASNEAAALYSIWGYVKAKEYYTKLKNAGISVLDGNSVVKDYVSQKKLYMGLVDTDDALSEMTKNKDLDILFMDQDKKDMGALVIPNTVCCIKGAPHPSQADAFMEFLLSASTEQKLVDDGWINIPVHSGVKTAPELSLKKIKIMQLDFNNIYTKLAISKKDITNIFVR
jgi:iron(III) transport system substrate-binding protein